MRGGGLVRMTTQNRSLQIGSGRGKARRTLLSGTLTIKGTPRGFVGLGLVRVEEGNARLRLRQESGCICCSKNVRDQIWSRSMNMRGTMVDVNVHSENMLCHSL